MTNAYPGYSGKRRMGWDHSYYGTAPFVDRATAQPSCVCECGCPARIEEYDDALSGERVRIIRCKGRKAESQRAGRKTACPPRREGMPAMPLVSEERKTQWRGMSVEQRSHVVDLLHPHLDLKAIRKAMTPGGCVVSADKLGKLNDALDVVAQYVPGEDGKLGFPPDGVVLTGPPIVETWPLRDPDKVYKLSLDSIASAPSPEIENTISGTDPAVLNRDYTARAMVCNKDGNWEPLSPPLAPEPLQLLSDETLADLKAQRHGRIDGEEVLDRIGKAEHRIRQDVDEIREEFGIKLAEGHLSLVRLICGLDEAYKRDSVDASEMRAAIDKADPPTPSLGNLVDQIGDACFQIAERWGGATAARAVETIVAAYNHGNKGKA